ncbi:SpoVG family protein [Clostridium tyrobutyricum]|uniref:SpoVG family protein n=1 Tax=Clostridium tyrobutyricum TaxID=1519 RepID=UPI00164EC451|nr:SpoVG family protein [Clostridium tyrobutyricum]
MEISNIRIVKRQPVGDRPSKLLAFASVIIDGGIAIHDIRIIRGDKELFLAFPIRVRKNGTRADIVHPINTETRNLLTKAIIDKFREETNEEIASSSGVTSE